MTPDTLTDWAEANTLIDLGALGADYFLGHTSHHPEQMLGDQYPAGDLFVAVTLADLNQAGFVTLEYLPGVSTSQGRGVEQRAAVQGFCDTITLEWLTAGLYGTRHQVLVTSTATGGFGAALDLNPGVPVLRTTARTTHRFGKQLTSVQIREGLYGGLLNPQAAAVLATSWNVTIFDPAWNSADLWPVLARAADPEPMTLARERRLALPAA